MLEPSYVVPRTPRDALDKLLRAELASAATYERALQHVSDPEARTVLAQNRTSHATRAVLLAQTVSAEGGTPSSKAGLWGAFTTLVEGAASLISEKAVLKTMHLAEEQTTSNYESELALMSLEEDAEGPANAVRTALREQLETEKRLGDLVS